MTGDVVATHRLPSPKAVRDLFDDLLGRHVEVSPCAPYAPGRDSRGTVAVYIDDAVRVAVVVTLDLPLSSYAGSAIGLVPMSSARNDIKYGELDEGVLENLEEVLNIVASLFNVGGAPHVRLHQVHAPGALPPAEISAFARVLGRRLDLVVSIAGYGRGRLGLVLV